MYHLAIDIYNLDKAKPRLKQEGLVNLVKSLKKLLDASLFSQKAFGASSKYHFEMRKFYLNLILFNARYYLQVCAVVMKKKKRKQKTI